jgi:hypothetical protein
MMISGVISPGADDHTGMVMLATGGGIWAYPTEEYSRSSAAR